MSGFLDRLVDGSRARSAGVQPRVAGRFEPSGPSLDRLLPAQPESWEAQVEATPDARDAAGPASDPTRSANRRDPLRPTPLGEHAAHAHTTADPLAPTPSPPDTVTSEPALASWNAPADASGRSQGVASDAESPRAAVLRAEAALRALDRMLAEIDARTDAGARRAARSEAALGQHAGELDRPSHRPGRTDISDVAQEHSVSSRRRTGEPNAPETAITQTPNVVVASPPEPARPAIRPAAPDGWQDRPASTTVVVSIGRVEVRAPAPKAEPNRPRQPAPRREPSVPLAAYLERREREWRERSGR